MQIGSSEDVNDLNYYYDNEWWVARGGKLHGNISRNGYGNAIIGRYGGCFEEGIWWVYGTGESCTVLERLAMVEG